MQEAVARPGLTDAGPVQAAVAASGVSGVEMMSLVARLYPSTEACPATASVRPFGYSARLCRSR